MTSNEEINQVFAANVPKEYFGVFSLRDTGNSTVLESYGNFDSHIDAWRWIEQNGEIERHFTILQIFRKS